MLRSRSGGGIYHPGEDPHLGNLFQYDRMIDGDPKDYEEYYQKLDISDLYGNDEAFRLGQMYDPQNVGSLISGLELANDNAIVLREEIKSESLSYIQMSLCHIQQCAARQEKNITVLQPVTDWALAFWGSTGQRMQNMKALVLLYLGRRIEDIDMMIRFNYPFNRIEMNYSLLTKYLQEYECFYDSHIKSQLDSILTEEAYNPSDAGYRDTVLKYLNQMIFV